NQDSKKSNTVSISNEKSNIDNDNDDEPIVVQLRTFQNNRWMDKNYIATMVDEKILQITLGKKLLFIFLSFYFYLCISFKHLFVRSEIILFNTKHIHRFKRS